MNNRTPITFISAELAQLDAQENAERHSDLEADLSNLGLSFHLAEGVYKGKSEKCFLIAHQGGVAGDYWPKIVDLALKYNQEALLHVGADRYGSLYYPSSEVWEGLGKLKEVTPDFAIKQESYVRFDYRFYHCG